MSPKFGELEVTLAAIIVAWMLFGWSAAVFGQEDTTPKLTIEPPKQLHVTATCIAASGIRPSTVETPKFIGQVRWSKLKLPSGEAALGFWLPGGGVFCILDTATETPET